VITEKDIDFTTIEPTELMRIMGAEARSSYKLLFSGYENRSMFCKNGAWAVPGEEALAAIIKHAGGRKILEVGAGLGLWACLLSERGANIVATDISVHRRHKKTGEHQGEGDRRFFDVQQMKHSQAIIEHADADVLMLCWPPYDSPMAKKALRAFKGDTLVYIGESQFGCTGCRKFHRDMYKHWDVQEEVSIPQWASMHDNLTIYKRKET
jgi:hypothetical protein